MISLLDEIKRTYINKVITVPINQTNLSVDIQEINPSIFSNVLEEWIQCLKTLNKTHLLKQKEVMINVYCYLCQCHRINNINNKMIDIDLFDNLINQFMRLETITSPKQSVSLKAYPICNILVVINCQSLDNIKVYKLYNTDLVKKVYNNSVVSFLDIKKDLNLEPLFSFNIYDLEKYNNQPIQDLFNQVDKRIDYNFKLHRQLKTEFMKLNKEAYCK